MAKPVFLFTAFEGGSPLLWDVTEEGVEIQPLHDHEAGSSNRQASWWNFRIHGEAGQSVAMTILPMENIYGGHRGHFTREGVSSVVSADGKNWKAVRFTHHPDHTLTLSLVLEAPVTHFALIQPYAMAEWAAFRGELEKRPETHFETIARTPEGRPVEMVTLSRGTAKKSVLVRARAHPWETGGSYFLEGMARRLLDASKGAAILDRLDFHFIPMANGDGVARGMSRFTPGGADLNRNFSAGYDHAGHAAPENAGLIGWLDSRQSGGKLPAFALDLHNDQDGHLHLSPDDGKGYRERMGRFDALLRKHTPYREGAISGSARGTFGEGLLSMYGIDAAILELNAQWLAGLNVIPLAEDWRAYGAGFAEAVDAHLAP